MYITSQLMKWSALGLLAANLNIKNKWLLVAAIVLAVAGMLQEKFCYFILEVADAIEEEDRKQKEKDKEKDTKQA